MQRDTLPTNFQCLFCNHENSVSVKLEKKVGVGHLSCKVCGQTFQTGINCELRSPQVDVILGGRAKDVQHADAETLY